MMHPTMPSFGAGALAVAQSDNFPGVEMREVGDGDFRGGNILLNLNGQAVSVANEMLIDLGRG
jgi:hypothetical protein